MANAEAAELRPVLHPRAQPLPFGHQGPFVTTADGGVLCVDAQHALHSADEGRTWSTRPVFRDPAKYRISNERALLRTRKGVVVAAWMNLREQKSPPGWNWGGKNANWREFVLPTYVCRSLDDGRTWEEPLKLADPWCGCIHSMIETRSGRIVLVGQEIIPEWRHATVVFVSDDQGASWKRSNLLDYGVGAHDHAGSIEGSVVERRDGSLYLLLRTESGWLYDAVSRDGGLLWEGLAQSQIRSVTCCPQMARLADGRIALLWNHPPRHRAESRTSREELFLSLSADDARTWSPPVVVAGNYGPGGRVSYPYLYERRPGELWITTMQGGLRMRVELARLAEAAMPVHQPPPAPAPKPGGIIMFGDSTTAERPGAVARVYPRRVQEALQGIGSSLSVHNAGAGSNTTRDAVKRFRRDVLQHRPRVVVIQFGINDAAVDVWKKPPATAPRVPLAEFEANLRSLVTDARAQGARVILMTTNPLRWTPKLRELYGRPPYLPDDPDGFDRPLLAAYNDTIRRLARELGTGLADVHASYPGFAGKHGTTLDRLLVDGMHPSDLGHELVSEILVPLIREQLR